jgi:hypothetical protein
MYELETYTNHYDQGYAKIAIVPDEDPIRPDDCDCEPEFFHAERGADLRRKLTEEFPDSGKAYVTMALGQVHKSREGDWYYGFTEYRHSGSAFALCATGRARNFPDQRWDVIDVAGWIKVSRQNRIDWGIHGKRGVAEKALANAKLCLKEWETYCNGWVVGWTVTFFDKEDRELDSDSCYGYYEREDALADANAAADDRADRLGWKEQP